MLKKIFYLLLITGVSFLCFAENQALPAYLGHGVEFESDAPDYVYEYGEDDQFEPNDDYYQAYYIELMADYTDLYCQDEDWYLFETDGGLIQIRIEFDSYYADLDMELYDDPDYGYLQISDGTGDTESMYCYLNPGEYYLRIYPYSGYASYTLTAEIKESTDEYEPNDSPDQAALIQCPVVLRDLEFFNAEWYMFTIEESGYVTVEIAADDYTDLDLYLYSDPYYGDTVAYSESEYEWEEITVGLSSGTYYIEVINYDYYDYSYETIFYSLTIEFEPIGEDDSMEPNDTFYEAYPVGVGQEFTGLKCFNEDWFSFRIEEGGLVFIMIEFEYEKGDLDLEIYRDPNSMPIISSYTEYDNETVGYRFEPGNYYIRVYSYNMGLSEYNLIIRK